MLRSVKYRMKGFVGKDRAFLPRWVTFTRRGRPLRLCVLIGVVLCFSIVVYNYESDSVLGEKCSALKPITTVADVLQLANTAERWSLNELLMEQDNPRILKYLRDNCEVLMRPPDGKPTTFKGAGRSLGQDKVARMILKNMRGGFFVEVGAFDGVEQSNTLEFERDFGWRGLLIEAYELVRLHKNHRNAWISHACLSEQNYPQEAMFHQQVNPNSIGTISSGIGKPDMVIPTSANQSIDRVDLAQKKGDVQLQCFPLYSFLAAIKVTVVDFLSLNVEGGELKILKTIPYDKVLIKVVAVGIITSREGQGPYREFMESKGFKTVGVFYIGTTPYNLIFAHNSVLVEDSVLELLKPKYVEGMNLPSPKSRIEFH